MYLKASVFIYYKTTANLYALHILLLTQSLSAHPSNCLYILSSHSYLYACMFAFLVIAHSFILYLLFILNLFIGFYLFDSTLV